MGKFIKAKIVKTNVLLEAMSRRNKLHRQRAITDMTASYIPLQNTNMLTDDIPVTFVTQENTEHPAIVSFSKDARESIMVDLCVTGTTNTYHEQIVVQDWLWTASKQSYMPRGEICFWKKPIQQFSHTLRFRFHFEGHLKQFAEQISRQ